MKMPMAKAAAMFWKEYLIVKLQGDDLQEAMALERCKIFTPWKADP